MDWSNVSYELLKEYFYDIYGCYPTETLSKEEIIALIKARW